MLPMYSNLVLSFSRSKRVIPKLISKPRDDNFKKNLFKSKEDPNIVKYLYTI